MSSNYTIAFAGMPALLDEQEHVHGKFHVRTLSGFI